MKRISINELPARYKVFFVKLKEMLAERHLSLAPQVEYVHDEHLIAGVTPAPPNISSLVLYRVLLNMGLRLNYLPKSMWPLPLQDVSYLMELEGGGWISLSQPNLVKGSGVSTEICFMAQNHPAMQPRRDELRNNKSMYDTLTAFGYDKETGRVVSHPDVETYLEATASMRQLLQKHALLPR